MRARLSMSRPQMLVAATSIVRVLAITSAGVAASSANSLKRDKSRSALSSRSVGSSSTATTARDSIVGATANDSTATSRGADSAAGTAQGSADRGSVSPSGNTSVVVTGPKRTLPTAATPDGGSSVVSAPRTTVHLCPSQGRCPPGWQTLRQAALVSGRTTSPAQMAYRWSPILSVGASTQPS